jgi:hypothetical protein
LKSWVNVKHEEVEIQQTLLEKLKKEKNHRYNYSRDWAIQKVNRVASDLEKKI